MSFLDQNLKRIYDTSEIESNHIFNELFDPLLLNAISYKRGVGYFTSSWLEMCMEGIISLAEREGNISLITSPHLEENDWEAFRIGTEAQKDQILYETLSRQVEQFKDELSKHKRTLLAWLVADEVIKVKIAIPRNQRGDFHDKLAIFQDKDGNKVVLHGSLNDSEKASFNGEGISVFCSWIEGHSDFVEGHEKRFDRLNQEENRFYKLYDLPSAIIKKIIQLRENTSRPYNVLTPKKKNVFIKPEIIELYPFQENAILTWLANDGRGLFEMATGTGKTITALSAAARLYEQKNMPMCIVISVPFKHLVEQWADEVRSFGLHPLLCFENASEWKPKMKLQIQDINKRMSNILCLITTYKTGSSDNFLELIKKVRVQTLFIADESHYLGSSQYSRLLDPIFKYRIGLSATPDRWFDDNGSKILRTYFHPQVIELGILEAVEKGFLTPYRFYPQIVPLNDDEFERYHQLTKKVIQIHQDKSLSAREKSERVTVYLNQRADIIGNADLKWSLFEELLDKKIESIGTSNIMHTLVYCAKGKTKEALKLLTMRGIRAHEFIHSVSNEKRSELLEQFSKGDIQVLVAIKCLDEGVNIPQTREAYFLASTTNPREFVQRRGRILRKSEGKKEAILYDFIVIPPLDKLNDEAAHGILRRELPRFAEFVDGTLNEFEARGTMVPLLQECDLLHLINIKPWDVYKSYQNEYEGNEKT